MRKLVADAGRSEEIELDSAGTGGWHVGSSPDSRSAAAGARRGLQLQGRARRIGPEDFNDHDLLVAMDRSNRDELIALAPDAEARAKVRLLLDDPPCDVPDPYYGGPDGFDAVLDVVEEGCRALLDAIPKRPPA